MKQQLTNAVSACSALAIVCSATPALAYGYNAHSRIVEEAVFVLQNSAGNTVPPVGVAQSDWDAFILLAQQTPNSLSVLRTGLPTSKPVEEKTPLLQVAPPADDPPTSEGFPFNSKRANCKFNPQDNLAAIGQFRVKDFNYLTNRSAPCGVTGTSDPAKPLQSLLGWHAGTIDDHLQDVVMWYRPTNAGLTGAIKHVASRALELVAGALLLPFVCIFEIFSSGSCNTDDAQDLATKVDPINYIDSWLPGFGNIYGSDYTGLWHFIDVADGPGQYSDIRGMLYESAGIDHPGVLDIGIMAFSDVTGLSLKPSAADGDNNYGQYDRVGRNYFTWQGTTIGHLEWSPVDHLAAYGWDRYKGNPTSADGLGWVLHALGDAGEPHHVTGTTSWGHRPYEDYVESQAKSMLLLGDADNDSSVPSGAAAAQHRRVLELAYPYFKALSSGGLSQPAGVGTIESLVQQVAQATYLKVRNESWPWNDSASLSYALGGDYKSESITEYIGNDAAMTSVIEESVGAVTAFLMYAGKFAVDPGLSPDISCPADTHFQPPSTCAPGAPPLILNIDAGACPNNGNCGVDAGAIGDAGTGASCSTSADCVVGTCVAGSCSTNCTSTPCDKGTCTAGACCAEDFSPCLSAQDCCGGTATCTGGVCQTVVP